MMSEQDKQIAVELAGIVQTAAGRAYAEFLIQHNGIDPAAAEQKSVALQLSIGAFFFTLITKLEQVQPIQRR